MDRMIDKLLGMFMFMLLSMGLSVVARAEDPPPPPPCPLDGPNCAAAPESGCDQKCRMRLQFVQITKGKEVGGVRQYTESHTRFKSADCDTCKGDAVGYCFFDNNSKDNFTDGNCVATTVKNKFQVIASTPLCDLKNWKTKANTGDITKVEAVEKAAKEEDFVNDPAFIRECKAKQ